jgi:energy-coupling factor transport system ATP-binding protein
MERGGAERLGAADSGMEKLLMLSLRAISLRFPHAPGALLDGVNLDIRPGECVGITGPSGGGKTLLGLVAAGIIPGFIHADLCGEVVRDFPDRPHRTRAAVVFQDPSFQLFARSVREELLYTPRRLGWPEEAVGKDLERAVSRLDLEPLLNRDPRSLSMGEAQRVAVGAAMMQRPQVFILDEPTQYIDRGHVEQTLSYVLDWATTHESAILLIEHHLGLLQKFCERTFLVERGHVRESAFSIPDFPRQNGSWPSPGVPVLQTAGLNFRYHTGTPLLEDISLTLARGESVALLGPNGCGKSTLAKILCGLLKPRAGEIRFEGRVCPRSGSRFRGVGYVMQNPDRQLFAPTVKEECAFAPRNFGIPEPEYEQSVAGTLEEFGIGGYEDRDPFSLSYGEKRRVNITGVLAYDPDVLILDEPTCALDHANQRILLDRIREWTVRGKAVLTVTHDLDFARAACGRAYVLDTGILMQADLQHEK